jgi:predicted MFS family arabinose efflux permease
MKRGRVRNLLTILALWCAGLGAAAEFAKISVSYDRISAAYAAWPAVWIGLMVSIVGLVGLIFGTTAGLLVARVGARRAMVAALLVGAVVSLLQSVLPPYPVMMLTRVLEGVAHLTIVVVGPTTIAGIAPRARQGAALSLWSTFFGLTYALLAWIAPPILAAGGIALLFRLHGLWMLVLAGILYLLMPKDRFDPAPGPRKGLWAEHLAIYASPFVAAPATGFVCYTITYVAVLTLLPAALTPGWGHAAGVAMPLVSIAVSLTLGVWLLARAEAVRIVEAGFALAVVAALMLWAAWGQGALEFAAALILGGALGLVQGASFAAIPQLNARVEDRARAAGAIAQMGNLGTTTGTPILALLMQQAGGTGLALFVMGFSALGVVIHLVQARRRQAA